MGYPSLHYVVEHLAIEQQRKYKGSISESIGASGGIVTLWNYSTWNYRSETVNHHWIKTVLENRVDKQIIVIYNIYVPNNFIDKEHFLIILKPT